MTQTNTVEKGRLERTAPYLKASQIEAMKDEESRLSATLNAPPHLRRAIQDPALMAKTLRGIQKALNDDTPREYAATERDAAVKREAELREKFTADMPTQAEMRRNPPGALEKHLTWEERHEADISEWKNIRRRMRASGMLPSRLLSDGSASNIELLRPAGGPGELSMDNAQIPVARTYSNLGGRSTPLSDRELELLKLLAPDIYEKVAFLTADQRDDIKTSLAPALQEMDPAKIDWAAMSMKEARDRCRDLTLETGGTKDDLIARLKEHYGIA